MVRLVGKSKAQIADEADKLSWLRINCPEGSSLPDIYNIPGCDVNGMGPDTWHGAILGAVMEVLNHPLLLPCIEECGDYHDWRYFKGGSELDRQQADQALHDLMIATVTWTWWNPFSWIERLRMGALADAYYEAVRWGGKAYFNYY
jgi:hypothetical protein